MWHPLKIFKYQAYIFKKIFKQHKCYINTCIPNITLIIGRHLNIKYKNNLCTTRHQVSGILYTRHQLNYSLNIYLMINMKIKMKVHVQVSREAPPVKYFDF